MRFWDEDAKEHKVATLPQPPAFEKPDAKQEPKADQLQAHHASIGSDGALWCVPVALIFACVLFEGCIGLQASLQFGFCC
jgi:hypothetical protein